MQKNNRNLLAQVQVIMLALIHGFQHIVVVCLPPLFSLIQAEFGLTYGQLGMLQSASRLSGGVLQIPAGIMADRFGRKKILLYGFMVMVSCLFLAGLAPTFLLLLGSQFLLGVGDSVFHPSTYALISQGSASRNLGRNMSIHSLGGWSGTAIAFGLIGLLGSKWGWRYALTVLGGSGLLFFAMLIFWIPEVGSSAAAEKKMANPLSLVNKPIILIFFIAAFGGVVRYGLMSFLPTFLGEVYGFSVVNAGLYSTIYLMAGAASTIFGGWLADRINRLQLVIFESVGTVIAVIVLSLGGSTSFLLILSLAISGAFVYFAVPAYNALLSFYSSPENQGWIYGVNFGGSSLGSLVGSLVIGYMADLFGFRLAFLSLAGFSLMRTAMLLIMRQTPAHSASSQFETGSN